MWVDHLLERLVEHKLSRKLTTVDPWERLRSVRAAEQFLGEAVVCNPTDQYEVGQELYVILSRTKGDWEFARGRVTKAAWDDKGAHFYIEVDRGGQYKRYICGLLADHQMPGDSSSVAGRS